MGTIKKGILGGFSGKVGNVVGSNWRGLDIMRSLPKRGNTQPTDVQMEQRTRFGMVIAFLAPFKAIIEKAYGQTSGSKSRFNQATSYHIQEAIMGVAPALEIDFSKVVLTKGELLGPKTAGYGIIATPTVEVTWQDNQSMGLSSPDDQVVLLAYCPVNKVYRMAVGEAKREDLRAEITIPVESSGEIFHGWLGFISADGKKAATSVYLGTIAV